MAAVSYLSLNYGRLFTILILICLISISSTASDNITATIEAPFAQQTTSRFEYFGIETFDTITKSIQDTYTTNFGHGANSDIQGTYYDLKIANRDDHAGAGEIGKYPLCWSGRPYKLIMSKMGQRGINYFGLWLSSLEKGNQLEFYYNGSKIFAVGTPEIEKLVKGNANYYGNPTFTPRTIMNQLFVFLNVYFNDVQLDEVRFAQNAPSLFESDNHSVGYIPPQTGFAGVVTGIALFNATVFTNSSTGTPVTSAQLLKAFGG